MKKRFETCQSILCYMVYDIYSFINTYKNENLPGHVLRIKDITIKSYVNNQNSRKLRGIRRDLLRV
jgi:hypothetical protein